MKAVTTYDFGEFMRKEHVLNAKDLDDLTAYKLIALGGGLFAVMAPKHVAAASSSATFGDLWSSIMGIVDWIVVGVITFAGITWMFGKQTRGVELLICGASGYLLARHAVDIRNFLKGI